MRNKMTEPSNNRYYFKERPNGKIFDGIVTGIDSEVHPVLVFCRNNKTWEEFRVGASFIMDSDGGRDRYFAPLMDLNDASRAVGAVEIFGLEDTLNENPQSQYVRMLTDQKEFDNFMTAYCRWLEQ
jgi:hypothetical protein